MSSNGSGFLTYENIRQKAPLPTRDVDVPEWGGKVRVRALTPKERLEYLGKCREPLRVDGCSMDDIAEGGLGKLKVHIDLMGLADLSPWVCQRTVCREDLSPIFETEESLAFVDPVPLVKLAQVALELSGLDRGALERAGKDSSSSPSVAPSSSSAES